MFLQTWALKIPIRICARKPEIQFARLSTSNFLNYGLIAPRFQPPCSPRWMAWQSKHTSRSGDHIPCIFASAVAADALHWWYDHRDRQRSDTTIRQHVVPQIVIKIVITIIFSSFNDVVLSNSMFVDCCTLKSRECGPIVAVECRRPP